MIIELYYMHCLQQVSIARGDLFCTQSSPHVPLYSHAQLRTGVTLSRRGLGITLCLVRFMSKLVSRMMRFSFADWSKL